MIHYNTVLWSVLILPSLSAMITAACLYCFHYKKYKKSVNKTINQLQEYQNEMLNESETMRFQIAILEKILKEKTNKQPGETSH